MRTRIKGCVERERYASLEEVVIGLDRLGINTGIQLNLLSELSEDCRKLFIS